MRITKHTAKPWKPTISSQETLHRFYLLLASHPTTEMWPNRLPRTLPQSPQYLPSLRRFSAAQPSPRPHRDSTRWSWHGPSPFFFEVFFGASPTHWHLGSQLEPEQRGFVNMDVAWCDCYLMAVYALATSAKQVPSAGENAAVRYQHSSSMI